MTVDFHESEWISIGATEITFFNQATSNASTRAFIVNPANPGNISNVWTGLQFGINGSSVSSPAGRTLQATNFTYNASNLTGTASGQIGIGGLPRFTIAPSFGGGIFIVGDFALLYDNSRAGIHLTGGAVTSGWYLQNHFDFDVNFLDFTSLITSNVSANGFDLSGDLVATDDSGLMFFGAAVGQKFGTFSLHASTLVVPEPSRCILLFVGVAIMTQVRRRHGAAAICRSRRGLRGERHRD